MIHNRFLILTLGLLFVLMGSAQNLHFEKRLDIEVKDSAGTTLKNPWIGGFNGCIMGEVDLNFDKKNDWVVYDQHAKKIFTFLNLGTNGTIDYRYAPEYESFFPDFTTWFQLKDFNADGMQDLFVFDGVSGVSLYKNTSQNHTLSFELYIPKLKAKIFDTYENLFCTNVDFPSFIDIDRDGDLDVLNFWIPSARNTLYYYKNQSIEKHGHADSLDFILESEKWGCFEEHSESNRIILNICEDADSKTPELMSSSKLPLPKHTGSTIFATDLNNDALQDLLLADFGYPNMVALYNGGTPEKAKITYIDTAFPKQGAAVALLNCPAISEIDVDNDGVKELIFSPFVNVDFSSESYASNWVYKNMSISSNADYQLISKRFLQEDMLDFGMGAYPTFVDIDNNGLLDIVVGNYGQIDSAWEEFGTWQSHFTSKLSLLRNIGTSTEPKFQLFALNITPKPDYSGAAPAFGDIDHDGFLEMMVGTENGEIRLYKATSNNSNPVPEFVLKSKNILAQNLGSFLAPQLFDLNNDGLLDLIVGDSRMTWRDEHNRTHFKGNINYLQNTGTTENPEFLLVTDSLGQVDVCNRERSNFGYSKPCFFKDVNGNTHLFCGNEDGKVLHYTTIDNNLSGAFVQLADLTYTLQSTSHPLAEGTHSAVAVADLNHDGYLDLVVGNHRGGLTFFYGIPTSVKNNEQQTTNPQLSIYPNPASHELFVQLQKGGTTKCKIFDLQGRLMFSAWFKTEGDTDQRIDISRLPKGVYILQTGDENQTNSQKIIKK